MWCQLQFVFMLLSVRMVFNQLFPGRVLSSVMEIFGSVSVWASSPSAHRRAASGWALWGLWARGCPLFSGGPQGAPTPSLTRRRRTLCLQTGLGEQLAGALSPQGPQGSGSWITGLRPGWEEQGLPQCPPARRRCKREKWGRSRRFLCPAECWPEVHLRGLRGKELRVQSGGFLVRFLCDLEDGQRCSSV